MIVFLKEGSTRVNQVHYKPELLPYAIRQKGYEVDSMPEEKRIERKNAELHYNKETNELYYEYIDRPLTEEERVAELEAIVADMLLADMGGA